MSTSFNARFVTCKRDNPENIATTATGNINLIPKTAIKIPQVTNLCCHFSVIFSNFIAFTTALSKDKVISSIDKNKTINTHKNSCPGCFCIPHNSAAIKPAIVINIEPFKDKDGSTKFFVENPWNSTQNSVMNYDKLKEFFEIICAVKVA